MPDQPRGSGKCDIGACVNAAVAVYIPLDEQHRYRDGRRNNLRVCASHLREKESLGQHHMVRAISDYYAPEDERDA